MRARFLAILLFICTAALAQQKLKKADRLFDEMAYVEAAEAYEEYINGGTEPSHETIGKIADTYYYIRNYEKAEKYYFILFLSARGMSDSQKFRYTQSLRIQKKYAEADRLFESTIVWKDGMQRERFTAQKHYLDSILKRKPAFRVTNIATNSRLADFGTAFYGSKIVYSSAKDTMGTGGRYYKYNNQPFLKLFVAERHPEDGSLFGEVEFFPKSQNNYHNATPVFADAETVYFSANFVKSLGGLDNDTSGTNNLQLLRGKIKNGKLETESLPFNSKDYSIAQPAVSADGKWLYFVSNMPGGYGETDIYRVAIQPDGSFGTPQNLGPTINTPHKEMFPFVQGDVLYFASEGHYGLGGFDVFMSNITSDGFTEPQNMGLPVNSNRDDFAFIISGDGSYGYFSSNRDGGKGDDDIYYFTKIKDCEQLITGAVLAKTNQKPIKGAVVKAMANNVTITAQTDADGFYFLKLPCGTVTLEVTAENYVPEKKDIVNNEPELKVDFELTGYDDLVTKTDGVEKISINPIYFDLDKYAITPQAAAELDKVVFAMNSFPNLVIKIESHTDSRASDDYNLVLSQNRAMATCEYIIAKGIDPKRIDSVTGYGETRLLNHCANDVPCTEEQHQLNRRSDFVVVRK